VIAHPADRLPGTFDQDVYIEILRRYHDAGAPADGAVTFTLHAFLRSMGRRADGRTYAQLRSTLKRLEHTVLESHAAYHDAASDAPFSGTFSLLAAVAVQRRRAADREQLALFPLVDSAEPGVARVVLSSLIRGNLRADHVTTLEYALYTSLRSAVARRLYRLLQVVRTGGEPPVWRVSVPDLASLLPLSQRYPSHLVRVLHPAHEMLTAAGLITGARLTDSAEGWHVEYRLTP
jgi:plasmid replication initiation protein